MEKENSLKDYDSFEGMGAATYAIVGIVILIITIVLLLIFI